MKRVLILFASLFILQAISAQQPVAPKTCEDVLPADTCNKLRDVAKLFNEKVGLVNEAIQAALDKHFTKVNDVLKYVKNVLIEKANNFKCEDVLATEQCQKLTDLGAKFRISIADLNKAIEEAIVNGLAEGKELYHKTIEILLIQLKSLTCEDLTTSENCEKIRDFADKVHIKRGEVKKALIEIYARGLVSAKDYYDQVVEFLSNDITCEQVLTNQVCQRLTEIAKVFKEKAGEVNEAIRAAIRKRLYNTAVIIQYTIYYMVEMASEFKCEDVLSANQCASLIKIANKFQVSTGNLTQDIKEAIADGITKGKALYEKTIEIMLQKINNLSCEQLIDSATCQKIKDFGSKVKASSEDIKRAVIDAYSKGLVNAKDFFKDAKEFLINEISCEKVLSVETCTKLKNLADSFGASFDKVMIVLKDSVANGVTKITDLYKKAIKYIMDKWLGVVTYRARRSIDFGSFSETLKKAIKEALDKLAASLPEIEAKLRAALQNAIVKGQLKLAELKAAIKKMIEEAKKEKQTPASFSLMEDLKKTMTELKNKAKENMKKVLEEAKVQLHKLVEQLKQLFANSVESDAKDEFLEDLEMLNKLTSFESNAVLSEMDEITGKKFDDMTDDLTFGASQMYDSLSYDLQQIDLGSWINDEIIAVIEKAVNKVFGSEL